MIEEELKKIGKVILKDSIEELKSMRFASIVAIREKNLEMAEAPFDQQWIYEDIITLINAEKTLIDKEIKNKQFKLNSLLGIEPLPDGQITDSELTAAKAVPIQTFYVGKLRKSGKKFVGKCPFHEEKSGSFFIYPDNSFYCFGCSARGDTIEFVMKFYKMDFRQAVKFITN